MKLVGEKKMTPNDKKKIKKSLTGRLNLLRVQYGFISTDDQKAAYRNKYKRKYKRSQNFDADGESADNEEAGSIEEPDEEQSNLP
jgi:hypothetical protein